MRCRNLIILAIFLVAVSCGKDLVVRDETPRRIAVSLVSDAVSTRAGTVALTDLNGRTIRLGATTGTPAVSESVYGGASGEAVSTDANGVVQSSSLYWPSKQQFSWLNLYVLGCTHAMGIGSTGAYLDLTRTEVEDGTVDYTYGFLPKATAPTDGTPKVITCHHLMAWLYDIKFKTASAGASAYINSVTVTTPSTVRFSLQDGSPLSYNNSVRTSSPSITPAVRDIAYGSYTSIGQAAVSSFRIPALSSAGSTYGTSGKVTMMVNYTIYANGYNETFTKSVNLQLRAGCRNTVLAVLPCDLHEIKAQVTVSGWSEFSVDLGTLEP